MIDRVIKNLKIIIAGVLLFGAGIGLVVMEKVSFIEAGIFFGVVFVLFFSRDGKQF